MNTSDSKLSTLALERSRLQSDSARSQVGDKQGLIKTKKRMKFGKHLKKGNIDNYLTKVDYSIPKKPRLLSSKPQNGNQNSKTMRKKSKRSNFGKSNTTRNSQSFSKSSIVMRLKRSSTNCSYYDQYLATTRSKVSSKRKDLSESPYGHMIKMVPNLNKKKHKPELDSNKSLKFSRNTFEKPSCFSRYSRYTNKASNTKSFLANKSKRLNTMGFSSLSDTSVNRKIKKRKIFDHQKQKCTPDVPQNQQYINEQVDDSGSQSDDSLNSSGLNEEAQKEIDYLIPKITHAAKVFGEDLEEILGIDRECKFGTLCKKLKTIFLISDNESQMITKYLFNLKCVSGKVDKDLEAKPGLIQLQLDSLIKDCGNQSEEIIDTIIHEFISLFKSSDDTKKQKLIKDLRLISRCDIITPIDIQNVIFSNQIQIEPGSIITYLCKESRSLSRLTSEAIDTLIAKLADPVKKFSSVKSEPKRFFSLNHQLTLKFMDSQQKPQQELSHEELIKLGEKWFKKFADFLFEEDQTLNDLIHRRVFYKVIDGFEYELIHIDHLCEAIKQAGFEMEDNDKACLEQFGETVSKDIIKVKSINKFLEELGITEKLPKSTRHLDYKELDVASIRLLNKINKAMEEAKISSIEKFIGEDNLDSYEVVSSHKIEKLKIIHIKKLRDILAQKKLYPYGQDLDDRFTDFLSISLNDDFDELIMLRKLKKVLKDIKSCVYFQRMGTDRATYESLAKDHQELFGSKELCAL